MILQYEEKSNVPTAKGRENKESHREKIFILSNYIIIAVDGRAKKLTEGRNGTIILKYILMSKICG